MIQIIKEGLGGIKAVQYAIIYGVPYICQKTVILKKERMAIIMALNIVIDHLGNFEIKIDIIADTYKRTDKTYYKGEFKNKGLLHSDIIPPDDIESYDERNLVDFCTPIYRGTDSCIQQPIKTPHTHNTPTIKRWGV